MGKFSKKRGLNPTKFLLVIFLIFVGMIAYLWEQSLVLRLSGREATLSKEAENLRNGNNELRAEIARLSKSDRISRIASDRLGMIFPEGRPLKIEANPQYGRGENGGWFSYLPAGFRKLSVISKYLLKLNGKAEAADR